MASATAPTLAATRARAGGLLDSEAFLVLALAAGAALALLVVRGTVGSDTWLTLAAGELVARHGLPTHDTLATWTQGRTWVDQQWLAQLLDYGVARLGGLRLLALLNAAAVISTPIALAALARVRGASARAVAPAAFFAFLLLLPFAGIRAQALAYPLAASLLWVVLGTPRPSPRRLALALPLIVVWANVHGSVLLGAGLVAACAAEAALRSRRPAFVLVSGAAVAAVFASPYALELPRYYRRVLLDPSFGKLVTEWQAPTVRTQPLLYLFAPVALILVGRRLRSFSTAELAALAAAAGAAFLSTRNIVWFGLLALVLVPRAVELEWPDAAAPRRARVNVALSLATIAAVALLALGTSAHDAAWYQRGYPAGARTAVARYVAEHPSARILATEAYADWLLWDVPAARGHVAFDARFELLTGPELERIARFEHRQGAAWRGPAAGADLLVLPASQASAAAGGTILYEDAGVIVATT